MSLYRDRDENVFPELQWKENFKGLMTEENVGKHREEEVAFVQQEDQ